MPHKPDYQKGCYADVIFFILLFIGSMLFIHHKAKAQTAAVHIVSNVYKAELVKMNDGDSGFINVWLPSSRKNRNFHIKTVPFRLFRVDTPEIRSKDLKAKYIAKEAKKFVQRALKRDFVVKYVGKDHYGRWLVYLYFKSGEDLAKILRANGMTTGKYENAKLPRMETIYSRN